MLITSPSQFQMSVFVLSPAEFGAIAATLQVTRDSFRRPIFPLSMAERWEFKALVEPSEKQTEEAFALSLIRPFVYRLYIANAMAERYTYMKDDMTELVIPLIDLPPGRPISLRNLLDTLASLSYNLVTNGGNKFLGSKDDEKLDRLISALKDEIIQTKEA